MPERPPPPAGCAQCGASIPRHARACPECGADERTGWRESSIYDGLDLPDEAWRNDDDSAAPSSSARRAPDRRVNGLAWYWWCVALVILLGAALYVLGLR